MIESGELKKIYDMFHLKVLGIAIHYLGSVQEGEEVMQDTFIKFANAKSLPVFKSDDHLKSWLFKIAINLSMDRFRKIKRQLNYFDRVIGEGLTNKALGSFELSGDLLRLLKMLNRRTRMAILLKHLEGMDYQEISKIMDIPEGTIKSMVSRGIKKMQGSNK